MSPFTSALWGIAGALAVDALAVVAEINRKKGHWPWTRRQIGPRVLAVVFRAAVGALPAAAMAHDLAGAWPAVCAGVTAPLVLAQVATHIPSRRNTDSDPGSGSDSGEGSTS